MTSRLGRCAVRTKMAEGVCAAGSGVCVDNSLLMNENDILLSVQSESSVNLDTFESLKSTFYMIGQNGELCSNFTMSSVDLDVRGCSELDLCRAMESDNEEFSSGFQSTCEENEDNCRKKRCTDRYDSSESSDSGVAVLSCTDCSGSSGTSDITEPGSPFSTTSSNSSTSESDPENSIHGKMPPTQSTETATWPWSGDIEQDRGPHSPPKRSFHDSTPVKRLKTNSGVNNNIGKHDSEDECVHKRCCKTGLQQGKITEYFKAQIKLQKKYESVKVQKNGSIVANNNKLAVYLSGNSVPAILSVPVVTKLPDVFQREQTDISLPSSKVDEVNKFMNVKIQKDFSNAEKCNGFSFITPPSACRDSTDHDTSKIEITPDFRKPQSISKTILQSVSSPGSDSASSKLQDDNTTDLPSQIIRSSPSSDSLADDSSSCVSSSFLSVSVNDSPSDKPSLPSPILSAPRTIRFPVRNGWKGHTFLSDIVCRWSGCEESFSTTTGLLEHLQVKHVNTQSLCETFVCLWVGCKVYDRASCSRSWLERHVLSHGGNKPFRCIVDGCGHRFSSQIMLERHVNSHFINQDTNSSGGTGAKKSLDATPNKLFRRNGKKLRYRRQPFSARMFDYFDAGIMEGLQHSLIEMTERRTLGDVDADSGNTITLYSKLMARRSELDGTKRVLLRWFPSNIINDEWVNESEVQSTRKVPLPSLSQSQESQETCVQTLFRRGNSPRCSRGKTTSAPR